MKKIWFIISIILITLCVLNFALCLSFFDKPLTMMITTIISGRISGISTLIVGIIAALQAKKYNDTNSCFLNKEFELEQSQMILQSRMQFVESLKRTWDEFDSNCDPVFFATEVVSVNVVVRVDSHIQSCILKHACSLYNKCTSLSSIIDFDYVENNAKTNAKQALEAYKKYFLDSFVDGENNKKFLNDNHKLYNTLLTESENEYKKLKAVFSRYISECDKDLNYSVFYKNNDVKYLTEKYSIKTNQKD